MKEKNIIKKLVVAGMVTTCLLGVNVQANNYHDNVIHFTTTGDGSDSFTDAERKLDDSSSYAKNVKSKTDWRVADYGGKTERNSFKSCTLTKNGLEVWTSVKRGQARYIKNLVNEKGYKWCRLCIDPMTHKPVLVDGVWSPDSI